MTSRAPEPLESLPPPSRSPKDVTRAGRRASPLFTHAQRMSVLSGVLLIVVLLVVLQLWLLTATVNAYLGGDVSVALPGALVSLACFGLNLVLLRYVIRYG